MIGYLKGVVSQLFASSCFLDVHGVGYRLQAPSSTLEALQVGEEALLYTYMSVREDAITLFGFLTQDEYDLFMLLIAVNGVGPKVALGILSATSVEGFHLAIHKKDIKTLTKMPGIGKKTAERIILELQDKIGQVNVAAAALTGNQEAAPRGVVEETLAALISLGYSEQEVLPTLEKEAPRCQTVESLLKATLKVLGSR